MILSAAASGVLILSVIAAAVSAVTRRRSAVPSVQELDAAPVEAHPLAEASRSFGKRLLPVGIVLGIVLTAVIAVTQRAWLHGHKMPGMRFTCEAHGGADRLLQLGNLDGFRHQIYTDSALCQQLFNVGLLLEWNFNQPEALRAFELAAEADPSAAMPHWGVAYALGPGANRDVTEQRQPFPSFCPEDFVAASTAAGTALKLARKAVTHDPASMAAEQDLAYAQAVSRRFKAGTALNPERAQAEQEYADSLELIGRRFNDSKALAIAAESYMNLSPWDYYSQPNELRPSAAKAERLLVEALGHDPDIPLALHLRIHVSEASSPDRSASTAGRGEPAADRLTHQGPWQHSQGHLLHMASHTFVRLGRYHDGVLSNVRAFQADLDDSEHCRRPYLPEHNLEMLIYAATSGGEVEQALRYAKAIRGQPDDPSLAMRHDEGLGGWTPLLLVQSVYALWDAILLSPAPHPEARGPCPAQGYQYALAVYHYTRCLALAARCASANHTSSACSQAKEELHLLQVAESKVVREEATLPGHWPGIYGCEYKNLSTIYMHTATARLAVLVGSLPAAEEALRAAASIEDLMAYQEPARLLQPVRHALGHVLLQAGKAAEAEQVYKENLAEHPDNGFGLCGLSQSLHAQGRTKEADNIMSSEFRQAWKFSDFKLHSSSPAFSD